MQRMRLVAAFSAGALIASLVVGGVAVAQSLGDDEINACEWAFGLLRAVDSPDECASWETPRSWNQAGQPGPEGPQGPAGEPGILEGFESLEGTPCRVGTSEEGVFRFDWTTGNTESLLGVSCVRNNAEATFAVTVVSGLDTAANIWGPIIDGAFGVEVGSPIDARCDAQTGTSFIIRDAVTCQYTVPAGTSVTLTVDLGDTASAEFVPAIDLETNSTLPQPEACSAGPAEAGCTFVAEDGIGIGFNFD